MTVILNPSDAQNRLNANTIKIDSEGFSSFMNNLKSTIYILGFAERKVSGLIKIFSPSPPSTCYGNYSVLHKNYYQLQGKAFECFLSEVKEKHVS